MKEDLLEQTSVSLLKQGYTLKKLTGSFDLVARKGSKILLIKIVEDTNSLLKDSIEEMRNVASYFQASSIIIARKSGFELENNVVYSRFGIPTINFQTFINALNNKFPSLKSEKGGINAQILGKKLRERREIERYSLNTLAQKIGVSQRMIVKYEKEDSEISTIKAIRLYDILGDVFKRIDIFEPNRSILETHIKDISIKYHNLGFESLETTRSLFDVIAKKEKEIILTKQTDKKEKDLNSLAKLIDGDSLVIFKRRKPKTESPIIKKEEFLELEEAKELLKFLKEFE